jgi:NlpC/P60 family putative phage cell wall peptidase
MSSLSRQIIVEAARAWIGTPYLHQGSLQHVGCDCLGLLRGVWRDCVGPEPEIAPPYTPDWAEARGEEALLAAALRWFSPVRGVFQAGDIMLFRWRDGLPAKHIGIATSSTTMIHAHDGACVCEVSLGSAWRRRMVQAFSFPDVK